MSKIIAMPTQMATHTQEVLMGCYQISGLEFSEPPVILDLGANIGAFSIWARERWAGAKIIAYEPHPGNYELLQKNITDEAEIHNVAVSDYNGTSTLWNGKHNCGEASLYQLPSTSDIKYSTSVISGSHLPAADILKLDTEGSEYPILSSYQHWDRVRGVMFEYHRAEDKKIITDFLLGKEFAVIEDQATAYADRGMMKFAKGLPKPEGVASNSVNILIGMPCYGGLLYASNARSVMELHDLLNHMRVRHDPRYLPNESLIPRARNHFGTACLCDLDPQGQPYTHLLFIDVDIDFTARDIISLIALDKEVAALPYSAKDNEWHKIVKAVQAGITDPEALKRAAGRPIVNADQKMSFSVNEAVEFPQLGTGLLLIKREVFQKIADAWPDRKYNLMNNEQRGINRDFAWDFFQIGVNPVTRFYDSEDYRFCLDARSLGIKTWLWPNAVTGHTGPYRFVMDIPSQAAMNIDLIPDPKESEANGVCVESAAAD